MAVGTVLGTVLDDVILLQAENDVILLLAENEAAREMRQLWALR